MSSAHAERAEYEYLQTPQAIRERCERVFQLAVADQLEHWQLDESKLAEVAARVLAITRATYPDSSRIPYHGRYRHFDVGGVPRLAQLDAKLDAFPSDEQLATRFELVITSVLLDAGAGPSWHYRGADGGLYTRSEGLAVASYELFTTGKLGGTPHAPRADALGLTALTPNALADAFQVTAANPLTGLNGRAALLRRLGEIVTLAPEQFGSVEAARVGNLGVWLKRSAGSSALRASAVLHSMLRELGPIWEGRPHLAERSLGDVWRHSRLGFVPFHKLSQWLTYSLLEPLEAAGVHIDDADALTGLAEYRNGGLYVDAGVLRLREPSASSLWHTVDSDLVIEWRALTIALLDRTADVIRRLLGVTPAQLPLARVLEGGTWRAGRAIARELRADGSPPLLITSDGTVF